MSSDGKGGSASGERRGFRGTAENAKTVMCTRFTSIEGCRFGDRCNFAHTQAELKPRRNRFLGPGGQLTGLPATTGTTSSVTSSSTGVTGSGPNMGSSQPSEPAWQKGNSTAVVNGGGQPQGNAWKGSGTSAVAVVSGQHGGNNTGAPGQQQGGGLQPGGISIGGFGGEYQLWGGRGDGGYGGMGAGVGGGHAGNAPIASVQGVVNNPPNWSMNFNNNKGERPPTVPSHGWTTHSAPDGLCYYYNSRTRVSQWERPPELDDPRYQ